MADINIHNDKVQAYLDKAKTQYTDDNIGSVTVVREFANGNYSKQNGKTISNVQGKKVIIVAGKNDSQVWYPKSNSLEIKTLLPNQTYTYIVEELNGTFVTSGSFTTSGNVRMFGVDKLGKLKNYRDIGGKSTCLGGNLNYGWIYRSGHEDEIQTEGIFNECVNLTLGGDICLRGSGNNEQVHGENPYNISKGGNIYSVDPPEGKLVSGMWLPIGRGVLEDKYKVLKTGFAFIAKCFLQGKSVRFHCHAGRDRAGFFAIALEAALGVSPNEISIDYELSNFGYPGDNVIRTGKPNDYVGRNGKFNKTSNGNNIAERAKKYLVSQGVSADDIETIREFMIPNYTRS